MQEFERAFDDWSSKHEKLAKQTEQLALHINEEDMSILNHRLILLNKQWQEIFNQVHLRKQAITDKLNKWSMFNQRLEEMLHWMDNMEVLISSNSQYHIEDLISKLENVSSNTSHFLAVIYVGHCQFVT